MFFKTKPENLGFSPMSESKELTSVEIDRIIEMAWEDRTPFEAIEAQFGLNNQQVIALMRKEMKASSFRMWRKRTGGRATKHSRLRNFSEGTFKCSLQKGITLNKISKRNKFRS
jgi:uncharacterized protein (TIGR03643 family)